MAIAKQLDLPVFGIDLFEPFIRHCVGAAARLGVERLCSFGEGDILTAAERYPTQVPADVVVFAALGDVLGSLEQTVGILRRYANDGGYLLIADDYAKPGGSPCFPRFENYRSRLPVSRRRADGPCSRAIRESGDGSLAREDGRGVHRSVAFR